MNMLVHIKKDLTIDLKVPGFHGHLPRMILGFCAPEQKIEQRHMDSSRSKDSELGDRGRKQVTSNLYQGSTKSWRWMSHIMQAFKLICIVKTFSHVFCDM